MADLEFPKWITDSFIAEVLETDTKSAGEVEVVRWKCSSANLQGTPTLSHMYRVTIEYRRLRDDQEDELSVIVKTPLECGRFKELADSFDIYGRETSLYYWYLPQTYDIHWSRPTPRAYDCPVKNTVVLEDLEARGYRVSNRLNQLDIEHCRQTLISLARFHAVSVSMQERDPDLMNVSSEDQGSSEEESCDKPSNEYILRLVDTLKKLPGCDNYAVMIEERLDNIYNSCLLALRSRPAFRVLNHGDPWTENIMFRYDANGSVVDAKLIDLQLCHFGSFAYDLMVFWWTSADEEVRGNHRKEQFQTYRTTLNETLWDLGVKRRLTEVQFEEELKTFAPFSVQIISHMLVVALEDPNNSSMTDSVLADTNEYLEETDDYSNNRYNTVLPKVLKHAEEFGAFE